MLLRFQRAPPGTRTFELRLIELLAVACHRLAADLYEQDDGIHKQHEFRQWRDGLGRWSTEWCEAQPTPFYHGRYVAHSLYTQGAADMVGYWAEPMIFGGVVLFDRGEYGDEVSVTATYS